MNETVLSALSSATSAVSAAIGVPSPAGAAASASASASATFDGTRTTTNQPPNSSSTNEQHQPKEGHRIKSISYLGSPRHMLLQNRNGPCPLLAAANALLLKGAISLPGRCISEGQISIDDVVNVLAERAVSRTGERSAAAAAALSTPVKSEANDSAACNDEKGAAAAAAAPVAAAPAVAAPAAESSEAPLAASTPSKSSGKGQAQQQDDSPRAMAALHAQHHLHEVLSLFPSLQYGMDVNPKFTAGCTGVEYTSNLTCFDLLGVELVHGWLLDTQDVETVSVVGEKTYNELVEVVIRGNEAGEEMNKVRKMIAAKEAGVDIGVPLDQNASSTEGSQNDALLPNSGSEAAAAAPSSFPPSSSIQKDEHQSNSEQPQPQTQPPTLEGLRQKHRDLSQIAHEGHLVNSFLTSTSHQLTYHGLHELHNHLSNSAVCVFFRNNHFATLTKEDGSLWLLVTDLGYANVSEVVWEKLDAIDGATTLYDEYFSVPEPRKSHSASMAGPTLSSNDVAGQGGQIDADAALALQLSKHPDGEIKGTSAAAAPSAANDQEGRLMAAATEASIKDWHNAQSKGSNNNSGDTSNFVAVGVPSELRAETSAQAPGANSALNDQGDTSFVPSDEALARALQAQLNSDQESEALARQLQAEEDAASRQRRQQQQNQHRNARSAGAQSSSSDKCVIS